MLSGPAEHHDAGHIRHSRSKGVGRVNTFGQVLVQFHENPTFVKHWFEHAKNLEAARPSETYGETATENDALPAPRLHIAIHICGSRGDVQPFIPIAKLLQASPHNHRVRICTHPAFKDFVESNGLEFFSIGGDPEALMAYMVKNPGLLPSIDSVKAGDITKRRKEMAEMFEGTWRSCIEAGDGLGKRTTAIDVENTEDLFIADVIIANPPSMGHIHCAEKLGIPLHMVFTMPWSPTKTFHHPLAAMDYGDVDQSVANYFSFAMMELLTWQGLGDLINKFRTKTLKLDPISPMWGFQLLPRLRVPYTYLWSQTLIPKPSDWQEHLSITGFSFLQLGSSYTPPEDLVSFLNNGTPPVYIGFGSIVVEDPAKLTKLVFDAVKLAGVRAIVSKGWGGVGAGDAPENIYLIGNCPHDWLFQHVSCVVHHGGAGTTAAGIALGRPTVVVPFFGDQPFWGQMIARAGAGPKPIPYKLMTAESLAASIKFALTDEVQVAVKKMASQIAAEDGAREAVKSFEKSLSIKDMRCHIYPERLAVWYDTQTGTHMSGLAACVLVERGFIHPKHLQVLRHKHWYVHEGAEGPLIGAIAAVTNFLATVRTDTIEFKARLKEDHIATSVKTTKKESVRPDKSEEGTPLKRLTSSQLETIALRMALRTYEDESLKNLENPQKKPRMAELVANLNAGKAERSRPHQIMSATAHYAGDLTRTTLQAPVMFWYNVANGFRNFPSYAITNEIHRRRDEITGIGSGLGVAGKEFVLGIGEALGGILRHPYVGAKVEGPIGFGKGIGRGLFAFLPHALAAIFALPGYTLKGIERELSKRRLTSLQAELYLIRLRQANRDLERATEQDIADIVARWKSLHGDESN
ncbi:hypothetical protein ACN47E_001697 [Coniothyrium glycines]